MEPSSQNITKPKQLERLIVKGGSTTPSYIPLTPLDIYLGHYITGGVYFFLRSPDITRMKSALAAALDRHPTFGACMVRESSNIGLHCGSTGAEFSVHYSDADCPDLRSTQSLITDALWPKNTGPDHPSSDYQATSYRFNSGWPVAYFRLVVFRNEGCALLLHHVHSQADGSAAMQFLQNWSRAYRGHVLSPPSGYSRTQIAGLATLPGLAPSDELNILRRTALQIENTATTRDGGSLRLDIAGAAVEHFVNECRRRSRLSLSSSDILHALAWRCFVAAQGNIPGNTERCTDRKHIRLYTLFDLRGIKPLGIAQDYDGSAVLGRCAEMNRTELLNSTIPDLALAFQQQIKPFTADDAQKDISYLAREYHDGHIDAEGNYANFIIGAWLDCRDAGGLIVNDLRRLGAADICFEERPARMETFVSPDINMVSIYRNDDGTITLHYVGERGTLRGFADHLKTTMAVGGGLIEPSHLSVSVPVP